MCSCISACLSPKISLLAGVSMKARQSSTLIRPPCRASTYFSVAAALALPSSIVSSHACAASFSGAQVWGTSTSARVFAARRSRMVFCPMYMPKPCSALSSNREFAQVGPRPVSLLTVYGLVAAGPPQMEEHPVALEMYIRSPNSWVIRRA